MNGMYVLTGCLRDYRQSKLLLRTSVLGMLRDLQYRFAVIYETRCILVGNSHIGAHVQLVIDLL